MMKFDATFVKSTAVLREKLGTATGSLAHYWQWMQHAARHAPERYPWYQPFCALVTEDVEFLAAARRAVLHFVDRLPAQDCIALVQYHHWAAAAPVARWGVMYDWIADVAPFTEAEHRHIRKTLLDYGLKHILPALQTKSRRDDNNQVLSLALAATELGWVFGQRRGPDPLAAALLDYGIERLHILMDTIPAEGYSAEGSSYMLQIFGPGMVFSAKLLEEITETPWLVRPAAKTGTSVVDVLRMCVRQYTPGGLCLPWDHHGFIPAQNFLLPVALAETTGESNWLQLPERLHTWSVEQNTMWGMDDKVWALLWWPDAPAPVQHSPFTNWMSPHVAGGLVDAAAQLSVVQAWDRCGNTGLSVSRCHVNPNTLLMEAFGSPLTIDGHMGVDCPLQFLGCQMVVHYFGAPYTADWSEGALGAHSCVQVDDRADYISSTAVTGEGLCLVTLPGLQAISADATAFYADGWPDVQRVTRTTFFIDDSRILITDRAEFAQPRQVSARFYLRPQAVAIDGGVCLETPEGVQAIFRAPASAEVMTTHIAGFSTTLEQASAQVDFRYQPGTTHKLLTVVDVVNLRDEMNLFPKSWWFRADAEDIGVTEDWGRQASDWWQDNPRIPMSDPWVAFGEDANASVGWYAAVFSCAAESRPTHLKLHRTTSAYRAWLDGEELELLGNGLTGWQAALPVNLTPGDHLVTLRTIHGLVVEDGGGTFWGEVAVQQEHPADEAAPMPTLISPGWLRLADDSWLLFDNHEGSHRTCDAWRSDARHARLTTPAKWAVADATFAQHDGQLLFNAETPCSLSSDDDVVTISDLPDGASATIYLAGAIVRLTRAGSLRVQLHGTAERQVTLILTGSMESVTIAANSAITRVAAGEYHLLVVPAILDKLAPAASMLALADAPSPLVLAELQAALTSESAWSVRCAAAWSLARRGDATAVPALLAALEQENPDDIYPDPEEVDVQALTYQDDPQVPTGEASTCERIGKRWRLRMQIIEALGQLRDPRAVQALSEILVACSEPYPVLAAAARALGRIGDLTALPAVERGCVFYEACTYLAARAAYRSLTGEDWGAKGA